MKLGLAAAQEKPMGGLRIPRHAQLDFAGHKKRKDSLHQSSLCGIPILADWFKESLGCSYGAGGRSKMAGERAGSGVLWGDGKLGERITRRTRSEGILFPYERSSPAAEVDQDTKKEV